MFGFFNKNKCDNSKKEMSDKELASFRNYNAQISRFNMHLLMHKSLLAMNHELSTVFDTRKSLDELKLATDYLQTAIIGYSNLDHIEKMKAISNWFVANVSKSEYENIYDKSAIAVSSLFISYAVQIEWINLAKLEYNNKHKDLWDAIDSTAKLLAENYNNLIGGSSETLKLMAPGFYKKYISKQI